MHRFDLGHQLVGEAVHRTTLDLGGGGVVAVAIPSATHDDLNPGAFGEIPQSGGIPVDADGCDIDQTLAAGRRQVIEFRDDVSLVLRHTGEIESVRRMPEPRQQVFVHEGEAQIVRRDGSLDRHHVLSHAGHLVGLLGGRPPFPATSLSPACVNQVTGFMPGARCRQRTETRAWRVHAPVRPAGAAR